MRPHLHTYQCPRCKTVATAPIRYPSRDLCCILCRSYMKWLWSDPVVTPAQQALYDRGPVWNPGTREERDVHAK